VGSKQGERPFDPRQHLRQLANGADYLDVKWRLAWMRSEHPDAQIETELLRDDEDGALFKAVVRLPEGGSAMAHASVPRERSAGHIEQAESKAVGRALAALGYGAEYTDDDLLVAPAPSPAPKPLPPTPLRPARERATDEERPAEPEPQPERRAEGPRRIEEARPAPRAFEPVAQPAPPTPTAKPAASPAPAAAIPATTATPAADAPASDVEDVSWNKFWIWAKRRGYRDANHLREVLGPDVMQHTPQEVRNMLVKHELDNPPPGSEEE
jgi:hypothetical protein